MPIHEFLPGGFVDGDGFNAAVIWTAGSNILDENDVVGSFWMLGVGTSPETRAYYQINVNNFSISIPAEEIIVEVKLVLRRRKNSGASFEVFDSATSPDFNYHYLWSDLNPSLVQTYNAPDSTFWGTTLTTREYPISIATDETSQNNIRTLLTAADFSMRFQLDGNEVFPQPSGDVAWAKLVIDTFSPEFWSEFVLSRED